jgi:hypothetical protein
MLASQYENGIIVIKVTRLPSACCMTVCTLIAKRTTMRIIRAVTGSAVHGRADKELVVMALTAGDCCMLAG